MRVKCHNCSAGYTLPASKLKSGRRVQFTCRRCATRIVVAVPDPVAALEDEVPAGGEAEPDARSTLGSSLASDGVAVSNPSFAPTARGATTRPSRPRRVERYSTPLATASLADELPPDTKWFVANEDGSYRKMLHATLGDAIVGGLVAPGTLVWRKGMDAWIPADETPAWAEYYERLAQTEREHRGEEAAATRPDDEPSEGGAPGASTIDEAAELSAEEAASQSEEPDDATAAMDTIGEVPDPAPEATSAMSVLPEDAFVGGDEASAAPELPETAPDSPQPAYDGEATAMRSAVIDDEGTAEASDDIQTPAPVVPGTRRPATDQRAVPLPVVRTTDSKLRQAPRRSLTRKTSDRLRHSQPGSRHSGSGGRLIESGTGARGQSGGRRVESGALAADADSQWAPATDTYIGPRGRHTHRIGSDAERRALLAQVERERALQHGLQRWQLIAVGTAVAAFLALGLSFYAFVKMRSARQAAAACAPAEPKAPRAARAE